MPGNGGNQLEVNAFWGESVFCDLGKDRKGESSDFESDKSFLDMGEQTWDGDNGDSG